MGESMLILTFVVIVIGGIGSIRGAFIGALLVGVIDTFGRVLLPPVPGVHDHLYPHGGGAVLAPARALSNGCVSSP